MNARQMLIVGACIAGFGVGMGAFGAHGLERELNRRGVSAAEQSKLLDVWEVAARYQMYHALGLIALGLIGRQALNFPIRAAGILFVVGVIIFSGCLYALVLSGVKLLGAIVPIGGLAMMLGWLFMAWGVVRDKRIETPGAS